MGQIRKMDILDWRWEPEFLPHEFSGPITNTDSGFHMQPEFLDKLLALRHLVGIPIVVNPNGGFSTTGHAKNSAHYLGLAVDFRVPGCPIDRLSNFIRQMNFNGVGFYEHWKPDPGFHVDMAKRHARWIRTKDGKYVSLTQGE